MSINTETVFDKVAYDLDKLVEYPEMLPSFHHKTLADLCASVLLLRAKIMQMDKDKEGKE